MRNIIRFFQIAILFLPVILLANVVVKGHVYNSSGQPSIYYEVHILSDSANQGCMAAHVKYTNPNGIYQDTLFCNGAFKHVTVYLRDCHGHIIFQYLPVPSSGIVEANFVSCGNDSCHARFSYNLVPTLSNTTGAYIRFHNSASTVAPGDSIVASYWNFGDGTALAGNVSNPGHVYQKPGNYTVCLKTISSSGCRDSICQVVAVFPLHCKALFVWVAASTSLATSIKFQSSTSNPSSNDSIISRRWIFGDGIILEGNTVDPTHIYPKPGNYNTCLYIKTSGGFTDTFCQQITIPPPPMVQCAAYFNNTDTGLTGHFFSGFAKTAQNDSITTRNWTFGDGQTLAGNVVSPSHHYAAGGTYDVCLEIHTRLGCENRWCKTVQIVGDSIQHQDLVKLMNVYPNPATTRFDAVIWSMYNNVDATLAIYDVYGVLKWSQKKTLAQGVNDIAVPLYQLVAGPYVFRLTTMYGVASRTFFKL